MSNFLSSPVAETTFALNVSVFSSPIQLPAEMMTAGSPSASKKVLPTTGYFTESSYGLSVTPAMSVQRRKSYRSNWRVFGGELRSPQLFCLTQSNLTGSAIGSLFLPTVSGKVISNFCQSRVSLNFPLGSPTGCMETEKLFVCASTNANSIPHESSLPRRAQPVNLTGFPGRMFFLSEAFQPPKT